MKPIRTLTPTQARRLAITRQHLAGSRAPANADGIMEVMRDLGCIQVDPINVVARTHLLVLWSRLGAFDPAHLNTLLWQEYKLFEYWAHCASIVLTEDYPIHNALMRAYPPGDSAWTKRVRTWTKQNDALRRYILRRLKREGALPARALEEAGIHPEDWVSTGWTSGRNVSRMLDYLWMRGKIMVVRRDGLQKVWGMAEQFLPTWTPREKLSEHEIVRRAAERSLHALGVATPRHIEQHFIRGRYPHLGRVLAELEKEQRIEHVQIVADGDAWRGEWYIHTDDLPLLNRDWEPRTTLLSPFDNLICDRARTRLLFDFDYAMEIYIPAAKRKYGYYVLPILHGDRLIGRLDPTMDRTAERLTINAVYAERDAPASAACAIASAIENPGAFLGAREIAYTRRVPAVWKQVLR
jgi:uncharacterized protein YcaQ